MIDSGRRDFIRKTALASLSVMSLPIAAPIVKPQKRAFRICLNPGAIGVTLSQQELLEKAIAYGFEAIIPYPDQLAVMRDQGFEGFLSEMKAGNITWGSANLPVQFRTTAIQFKDDFERLQETVNAVHLAGASRMSTWIMPTHEHLTYRQNFDQHTSRLKQVARLLGGNGIRLGLEYVGPKTLMSSKRYAFIRTMKEVQELIHAIDEPNVGIQLDAFHWFCAGETKEDLLSLKPADIVTVDLNDAKLGRTADEQLDWERELPTESGVIDIKGFLEALVKIGYDGPVRAEPFNADLNKLDSEEALQKTIKAMHNAISKID